MGNKKDNDVSMDSVNELPTMDLNYLPRHADINSSEQTEKKPLKDENKPSIPPKNTPTILT